MYGAGMKRIGIVQIGFGTVGGALLEQLAAHRQLWRDRQGLDIRVDAIAGRNGMFVAAGSDGFSDEALRGIAHWRRVPGSTGEVSEFVQGDPLDLPVADGAIRIVLDAAAGEKTADLHTRALMQGHGVVLSNKAPLALPLSDARSATLWGQHSTGGRMRYEATCGAGLPVISSVLSLLDTGDEVLEITGALSGTFGAIFSDVAAGVPFSAAVRSARERGFTEPDPRDDLSGLDVARKALILARTIGRDVNLDDIAVRSLVPEALADLSIEDYLAALDSQDVEIGVMGAEAAGAGAALKYVASVPAHGPIEVGLRYVPTSTVLGALQGPENIVSVRTNRYDQYPLVISGPGAGAAVTAAGMVADMLSLARQM
jgi:homoserine dehydrogenase